MPQVRFLPGVPIILDEQMIKDVLLIERFDRLHTVQRSQRKSMVSVLTLLGLDEMMARYASYQDLAEIIRHRFTNASATLKELFTRLVSLYQTGKQLPLSNPRRRYRHLQMLG